MVNPLEKENMFVWHQMFLYIGVVLIKKNYAKEKKSTIQIYDIF